MGNADSKTWVLLAAGSKDWHNYRHQADVCHAYQVIHKYGIPDEQIVVMMFDDIAHHPENPYKGNIINVPQGTNVYNDVPKDYTGHDVSADNFLAVLQGDDQKSRSKKVLKSGPNDSILIYLSDHGSPGMFSFPKSTLYAYDLTETVKKMADRGQFSKMVIYMESCHSGSMLQGLPTSCNVYGISASNPVESSYACFFDERRNAYLADSFTAWLLHHIKTHNLGETTLQDQFRYLKSKVRDSSPCCYGNMQMGEEALRDFWGYSPADAERWVQANDFQLTDTIPSKNVYLTIQRNRTERQRGPMRRREHESHLKLERTKSKIERVVREIEEHCQTDFPGGRVSRGHASHRRAGHYSACDVKPKLLKVKIVAEHFRTTCFDWHDEQFEMALHHMHVLSSLIDSGVEEWRIMESITAVRGKSVMFQRAAYY